MNRRGLLRTAAGTLLPGTAFRPLAARRAEAAPRPTIRVRPGDTAWPSAEAWSGLDRDVGGQLVRVVSPLNACMGAPSSPACAQIFGMLRNPYYLGDEIGLTQTLGWVDAWTSQPSVYGVAARTSADVVAAVDFARRHHLRLVVKGGGHSYQGTSSAADSLLVWTRRMNTVSVHDAFVGAGCARRYDPQPAVSVGAGAIWGQVYDAVTTQAGRYVQGGGCLTVGVAGLISSGGFGSFSKAYGTAAAGLIEAEIVTADSSVVIANACSHPDLFWAIKGGGGGSFGVITRLTLRTHALPATVGAVRATIRANSDSAYRRLVDRVLTFYGEALLNPHWGEQIAFRPGNVLAIEMVFQGLDRQQADDLWRPFFTWLADLPQDFSVASGPLILDVPARQLWNPTFLRQIPGLVIADGRHDAPEGNVFWAGNLEEAGQVLHGYQSCWLPAALLRDGQLERLGDALFAASRHWGVALHVNKGLAGAPAEVVDAARNTATNPAVLDAFALLISGAEGPPAYPGIAGHEPDISTARRQAQAIDRAVSEVRALLPEVGSYLAEGDYFDKAWRQSFWGPNYARLLAVKDRYDPDGLFVVHHGVGSERWSADGFTRLT